MAIIDIAGQEITSFLKYMGYNAPDERIWVEPINPHGSRCQLHVEGIKTEDLLRDYRRGEWNINF